MGRPRKKPEFDHEKIMTEVLDGMVQAYKQLDKSQRSGGNLSYGALKDLADEMDMKPSKIRKLLITAGVRDNKEYYENDASRLVLNLYREGKSNTDIMKITGLGRSSVLGYLPYKKGVYKADELSTDAERIKLFRERQRRCQEFSIDLLRMSAEEREQYLWDTLVYLSGCVFYTSGRGKNNGVRYRYTVQGGEMIVDRKEKSITKSTIMLAFARAQEIQQSAGCVSGPKKLGTFGASYLYPIFLRLGICTSSVQQE